MTTMTKLVALAFASIILPIAGPAIASMGGTVPDAAYFTVHLDYCTPMEPLSGRRPAPTGDAAVVYSEVLIGTYGGNCHAFFAREVKPRLFLSHEET